MESVLEQLARSNLFKELRSKIDSETITLRGMAGSLPALFLSVLFSSNDHSLLLITPEPEEAENLYDELRFLLGEEKVLFFPANETSPYETNPLLDSTQSRKLQALNLLIKDSQKKKLVLTFGGALMEKLPDREQFEKNLYHVKVGETVEYDFLIEALIDLGYERQEVCDAIGTFAVRGGIIDIFPWSEEEPVRVEYFGNMIESIRQFDLISQRSKKKIDEFVLSPLFQKQKADLSDCVLDYLPPHIRTILFEPEVLFSRLKILLQEREELFAEKGDDAGSKNIGLFQSPDHFFFSPEEVGKKVNATKRIYLSQISATIGEELPVVSQGADSFHGNLDLFRQKVAELRTQHISVKLVCENEAQMTRLKEFISLPDIEYVQGEIFKGFIWTESVDGKRGGLALYTEHEIFGHAKKRKPWRTFKPSIALRDLQSLRRGDYVVHADHGIGQYGGLQKLPVGGMEREVLKITYAEGDVLYVSIDRLNRLQKYSSEEGASPPLNKLGAPDWERLKDKTKRSVQRIAKDLIALYATRKALPGFAFHPDTTWQNEFEESFIFEDTPDQEFVTGDIKKDMESARPMDRLICGDVGYGKTEVAMRAAFKAVQDGKQVAVLVPTTILCQQHFKTFSDRMSAFPIKVDSVSRFKSLKDQKLVLEKLQSGLVDIVIGTHRLLSQDVHFKDLGLVIVDEEQRFGVKHKEKLKKLRASVDVITLTATPIPRTLHLSLMGARDLSMISTPPKNRHPIITSISEFDDHLIRHAVLKELERGGQVFFVHNRVESIEAIGRQLKKILPTVRFGIAHGQMHGHQLEKVMTSFYDKEIDVLISTMIIENGLDIPNVNTIIINRADRFGLSQLYQLRGRVGRSDHQAYAYLLIPAMDTLNRDAIRRLQTLREFTALGSGFQIAMRDLEIRGAGNLLGHEQSGYMQAVGFEMYVKILEQAVAELKQETFPEEPKPVLLEVDTRVEANVNAYLSEDYIPSADEKVDIYRRLARAGDLNQVDLMEEELIDRFGKPPTEAENVLDLVRLKILGKKYYFSEMKVYPEKIIAEFDDLIFKDKKQFENILKTITEKPPSIPFRFSQEKTVRLILDLTKVPEPKLKEAIHFLK